VAAAARAQQAAPSGATRPSASDAIVSGRVVQQDGKPVGGASVVLIGTSDTVATTDDGGFTLRALPGAYVLSIRRLGFRLERFAVTLTAGETREVTIVANRAVPVLPTVTTTAQERAAYRSVGFEQRMEAGNGQFLTYEQIVQKQAPKFSLLLRGMRGVKVWRNSTNPAMQFGEIVEGTRGAGSCVSFIVDGVPQQELNSRDADNIVDISSVAAVEVYSPSERPAQFGSLEERPPEVGNPASDPIDPAQRVRVDQQCTLVMVWSLGRLGLPARDTKPIQGQGTTEPTSPSEVTEALAVFRGDATCKPGLTQDTTNLVIYATLEGTPPGSVTDSAWTRYRDTVLSVLERFAALPSQLILPAFGLPLGRAGASVDGSGADGGLTVAPTLSNVIAFTLDPNGSLLHADVAASSLSGAADTSVLAAVQRASAVHALPPLPVVQTPIDSAPLYFLVASIEPAPGTRAAVLGQLQVPVWPLAHRARLAPDPRNQDSAGTADSVMAEMVIDPAGRAVPSTVRTITGPSSGAASSRPPALWVDGLLQQLTFEPAVVGTCRVPELVLQKIAVPESGDRGR
jgi:hypothetical protein